MKKMRKIAQGLLQKRRNEKPKKEKKIQTNEINDKS